LPSIFIARSPLCSTPVIINLFLFFLNFFLCRTLMNLLLFCALTYIIYKIYIMYIIFVCSKPTFESFCLPSSRYRKWPFLSFDRILLKNLSRRKLGAVNTFAIQGTIKDEVFIVISSPSHVYNNSLRNIWQFYLFIECWCGSSISDFSIYLLTYLHFYYRES
jgi:hypothetical protein